LVVTRANGQIVYANTRVQDLTGFGRGELVGSTIELLVTADILSLPTHTRSEALCRRSDGGEFPVEVNVGAIEAGEPLLVVTLRDLSDLQAGRDARFEAEAKYQTLVEHIPAVVYLDPVDEDGESIYVSPQIRDLIGIEPAEWLKDPYAWRHHVHPEDIDRAWNEYKDSYNEHRPLNHEYRMRHEDGTVRWVLEQAFPINDEAGKPWLIQGVIFDITERKNAEEQVAFLAYHDKLTGLPNRVLFEELLETSIARARRNDTAVGVLYLDLDNFKMVNDSLGHHSGDLLLAQLGDRLRTCTRDTDLVARQGGDEFLLLLSDLDRDESLSENAALASTEMVAHRVREALAEPFELHGTSFFASGSIGISLFPHDAQDAETLMKNADAAMYRTKRTHPGGFTVFTTGDNDASHQFSLTSRLREAVREERWVLHWQPIVHMETGHVESLEALIRWQDPKGGLVAPLEFIPLAEELGLIEAIGDWVIAELVRQQREWDAQGLELRLGFNLSPRQLWSARLAEKIVAALHAGDVDPRRVIVEITESTAMADPDRTQKILSELHSWGFTLALDDFGTGYSSLARLKHMPVDILKIDKAFVHEVHNDISQASMVRAMIQLAQGLDMTPLAEGVETQQEYGFLRANGCRLAQGFLFSRAVPAEEIPALVARKGGLLPSTLSR
ncbi:MAG: EAL domain-containing protein, partial [Actinomycetota bacterium]|nr:EAL domain-containing protein [Actinomycetota bacterium]